MPLGTVIDDVLTMRPPPAARIAGTTALQHSHVPRTFTR